MTNERRKRLDEFSDESEQFESRFERLPASEGGEAERARLVAEVTAWMQECAKQGRYIPLASGERRAFRSLLERWNSRLRGQGHYVEGIDSLADFDPKAGIVLTGYCPYPGLEPYTQSRRGTFFGREALVARCVAHLEQKGNRILLIIGASGSGKSSLALAGVLPRLVELHDEAWFFCPRLTPGAHPLGELSATVTLAVGQPDQASAIERALTANPGEAGSQMAALCRDKPLMLFIDQFEELLTMCLDAAEQSVFAQVLCALSEPTKLANGFSCRILLTMRTDHLARFESNRLLTQLHMRLVSGDNQHYLSAVGFEDIKRAIKGPADDVGLRFNPATLIDQLASETAGLANGLPLLQFALRRLWDTRPKNESGEPLDLITAEMVQGLPDVERALGTVADAIFRTFSAPQQRVCERLLLELVVLDESFEEPLRRRRNEAELIQVLEARFPSGEDVAKVIDEFLTAGLLRRFGERPNSRLEVAHEALLRHWDHIYRLLTGAEVKERLHLVKQIDRDAADWAAHDKSNDYLSLRGERLVRAITLVTDAWLAGAEATAYVDACKAQEEAERLKDKLASEEKERADAAERARQAAELRAERTQVRIWRLAVVAGLVMILGVCVALYAVMKLSSARGLALNAGAEVDRNPQGSLLLSIEAAQTLPGALSPEVESALRSAIRASRVSGLFKSFGGTRLHAAAYAPDGSVLALGDSLGGVTFWDVATGLQRRAVFAHVDDVQAIAFAPDGRKIATGSADGKVVIWDTESAMASRVLNGHVDKVTTLAFSRPDGRLLATASDDASVRIWNVATGAPVGRVLYGHIGGVKTVAFGPDERQLVSAGEDDRVIMWDGQEGRVLYSIHFPDGLFDIDLSTDGSLLAVATRANVEIWDTGTRGRRWILTGHTNSVTKVRFGRDQRLVATAGYDSTVRVWQLRPGDADSHRQPEELARIRIEPSTELRDTWVTALAFGPEGDSVAAAFYGGAATIWNVATGAELLTLTGHETPARAVAFNADGATIAAAGGSNGQVLTWDLAGRRQNVKFKGIRAPVNAVAFSKAGAFAIGSRRDVLVQLSDATHPIRLERHTGVVNDLAFSPDGSRLVSGSRDGTAIVWELPSGKPLRVLKDHSQSVDAVAYSPDGKIIATGSRDARIILWDADTLEPKPPLKGQHLLGILDLAFTPDSKRLVSGSMDKTVRVWDVAAGTQQAVLAAHTDVVNAVAIYGDHLATGGDDGIRLWKLGSLAPLPVFPARSDGARRLAFSPDGRYLAAGANDGVVRVYAMQGKGLLELANKRVYRGWTPEECRWFLERDKCPRTRFSILDEAYRSFKELDVKSGERLLREARSGGTADAKAIDAEVNSHLGAAFLVAASSVMENPRVSKEMARLFLLRAKETLADRSFDPEARWRELNSYQAVKRARELARKGELKESTTQFVQARDAGWEMSSQPEDAASQLFALRVLSDVSESLRHVPATRREALELAKAAEDALKRFPAFAPGHQLLAMLYELQKDYARAEKHYLEAAASVLSAEPYESLARLKETEYTERRDIKYAESEAIYASKALKRDPGSDKAWFSLGYAEHVLKNEKKAVEAFDRVSPYSEFSADALNAAGGIYFEELGNDQAAYVALSRATQLAPDKLSVLSNYAEFLLALGRDGQAQLAAKRARQHPEAQAYQKAAMSFVVFAAEMLSGDHGKALAELDEIDRYVRAAAEEAKAVTSKGEKPETWGYKGIRRSLERRFGAHPTEQRSAVLLVLTFVQTNGRGGTLNDVGRLLRSETVKK